MCVDVLWCLYSCLIMSKMELCTLEDEDYDSMFLTQESGGGISKESEKENAEKGVFLGVGVSDFRSPCKSLVSDDFQPDCSDISDVEMADKNNFE